MNTQGNLGNRTALRTQENGSQLLPGKNYRAALANWKGTMAANRNGLKSWVDSPTRLGP